jgi:hypothetical protein
MLWEVASCYRCPECINIRDMDKLKAIIFVLIVLLGMAVLRVVFAQRKNKPNSSAPTS